MPFIPEKLTHLREVAQLSQGELAGRLGVSQSTVSAYETGRITPGEDVREKIASLFAVTLDYLNGRPGVESEQQVDMNPALPPILARAFARRHLRSMTEVLLYTNGVLSADEVTRLQAGVSPASIPEERMVKFLNKFNMEDIRDYYQAARLPLPQEFVDLLEQLRSVLAQIRMKTDGSPEALKVVIDVAREVFDE